MSENFWNSKNTLDIDSFLNIYNTAFNETTLKQKSTIANNGPFINKTVLKAVMKRNRLRNTFLKYRSEEK